MTISEQKQNVCWGKAHLPWLASFAERKGMQALGDLWPFCLGSPAVGSDHLAFNEAAAHSLVKGALQISKLHRSLGCLLQSTIEAASEM